MRLKFLGLLLLAATASGCMQTTAEHVPEKPLSVRDKALLDKAPYAKVDVPEPYRAREVAYHRKEVAGTIVIDTDARLLYFVLPGGRAIRYGVAVGEEGLTFSGVARVGRMAEWPPWTPTAQTKQRLGNIPDFVPPGPQNPMGARGIYLYTGQKDTLYRVHGTNQPEYIGQAISSGCIRMTNEDVIDLYEKVKVGAPVVVLGPGQGDSPFNPQKIASLGRPDN